MKLRYTAGITLIVFIIALCSGIYSKAEFYKDYNEEEAPLEQFLIGFLSDDLANVQIAKAMEELGSSPIIVAARCEDTFTYRFSCTSQKIKIEYIFQGEELEEGDTIEIIRASSGIFIDRDNETDEMQSINMGFINEMIPGNTYLIFLDRELQTHDSNDIIYMLSDEFFISPIFSYSETESVPCVSIYENVNYVNYVDYKNNEFFLGSREAIEQMYDFKESLLERYLYYR